MSHKEVIRRTCTAGSLALTQDYFDRAAAGHEPIAFVNAALGILGELSTGSDLGALPIFDTLSAANSIQSAIPALSIAVLGSVPANEILQAMEAAMKLLTPCEPAMRHECLLLVALLKLELSRLIFRQQMAEGDFSCIVPTLLASKSISGKARLLN